MSANTVARLAGDVGWSTLYPEADWPEDFLDARKARLGKVIEDIGTKTLRYIYDFGDGWKHTIKIEALTDPEPGVLYPRLIAATGRCPPEDCGGPWGYAEFLDAIRDPAHERHAASATFDAAAKRVTAGGGRILGGPLESPGGSKASIRMVRHFAREGKNPF
jgi:Plasmid pRiA4b ORF-3-like protein